MWYHWIAIEHTVEPLSNDHPHQRPSLLYDHILCDVGRTPAGNISLSTAILAAGAIPSKVLRVLSHMQVATISTRTFCRQQRAFLFPAVRSVWAGHQAWIIASLRAEDKDVVLGGDGRCDSPGHSARFGSYTMMDLNTNVIIDMQLIQVIPMTRFY